MDDQHHLLAGYRALAAYHELDKGTVMLLGRIEGLAKDRSIAAVARTDVTTYRMQVDASVRIEGLDRLLEKYDVPRPSGIEGEWNDECGVATILYRIRDFISPNGRSRCIAIRFIRSRSEYFEESNQSESMRVAVVS